MSSSMAASKKIENQNNNQPDKSVIVYQSYSSGRYIYSIFHIIMSLIAIYLSYKCNKGFNIGSFIIAICCPYIYIIYTLATKGTC
jgi:hypothetical protein